MSLDGTFILKKTHIFWIFIVSIIICVFILISQILMPFLIALIIATFFSGIVSKLEKIKIPRFISSAIIVSCIYAIVLYIFYIIVPMLYDMLISTIKLAMKTNPHMIISEKINQDLKHIFDSNIIEMINKLLNNSYQDLLKLIQKLFTGILQTSMQLFEILGLLIFAPILSFLALKDINKMKYKCYQLIPKPWKKETINLLKQIHHNVIAYMQGQFLVACILTIMYGLLLLPLKLHHTFLIGALVGFASFVPYVGFYLVSFMAMTMAYSQFGSIKEPLIVFAVLMGGQVIEGNYITPKIIGDKMGIHPGAIIFGVLSCVPVFGFIGVIFAIPITGIITVLLKFAISKYKKSIYYDEENND